MSGMATTSVVVLIAGLVVIWILGRFFVNMWFIATGEDYHIPKESSVFSFKATVMNSGSGDWWVYGEDLTNYYHSTDDGYVAYEKKKAADCRGFSPVDSSSWCSDPDK